MDWGGITLSLWLALVGALRRGFRDVQSANGERLKHQEPAWPEVSGERLSIVAVRR